MLRSTFAPVFTFVIFTPEFAWPICSISPLQITLSSLISKSLNLIELDPEFITSIFISYLLFWGILEFPTMSSPDLIRGSLYGILEFPSKFYSWRAEISTVFTISSTLQPLLRSFTGFFSPCKIGPIARAFALLWTAL